MVSPILSPNGFRSRSSFHKRFFLIALLALLVQAGCKNESGITELSNIPEIRSTNPASDAVDIAVNTSVIATFSDEMNPSTFTDSSFLLRLDTASVPGTISYTDSTATFIPSDDLEFESTYTATITADVQNLDGNAIADDYEWEFTTTGEPEETDDTPPQVDSTTPADDEEDVSINTAVIATFNEPMNGSTINNTTFSLEQESTPISGTITYSESKATFSPSSPLDFDKIYTATVTTNAEDTAGNALAENYSWSFTTSDQPDNTPPQITATDPTDNEQDVSVSSTVTVMFNERIRASSIGNSTFRLERGDTQVSGTYNVSGNSATFTPSGDLSFESSYTATVTTGVEDIEGNNLENDFSWNFTTSDEPDNTAPEVTSVNPTENEQNVSVNTDISATFNEPVTSPNAEGAITVEPDIPGSIDISGRTVTFIPSGDLEYEREYSVTVTTDIRDLAGNNLKSEFSWDFTTAEEPDNTPPQITSTEPGDGADDISIETQVSASFNEPVNASDPEDAFVLEQGGSSIPGSVNISGSTITFTPASDLNYESTYTATITTAIEDSEGNNLENDFSWSFTTADEPDNTPPQITSTEPGDGADNISIETQVSASFTEPVNASDPEDAFILEQNGSSVPGSVNISGSTITFTPASDLNYESTYTATITTAIEDSEGNNLENDFSWSFTTADEPDNTPPRITGTEPGDGASNVPIDTDITATFSEPLNTSTVTNETFSLEQDNSRISGSLNTLGSTVVFTPSGDLDFESTYSVTATTGIEDEAGNSLENEVGWTFTTEEEPDNTAPEVNSTSPADGATNISIAIDEITITFNENMNPDTFDENSFTLTQAGDEVDGNIPDFEGATARFIPADELEYDSEYLVIISSGVEDLAGNNLGDDFEWSFITENDPNDE